MSNAPAVRALVAFFEGLCPEAVARFPEYYASDAYFKDPFNEVRGLEPIQRIFAHMFSQVAEPRFVVLESVVAENGALLVAAAGTEKETRGLSRRALLDLAVPATSGRGGNCASTTHLSKTL
jgi:ketosteroid isomerase-like protein